MWSMRMLATCCRTNEFALGCVGELSDRGDCGFWGDSGGCMHRGGAQRPALGMIRLRPCKEAH